MFGQQRDILGALAQSGDAQGQCVNAEEKVLAKAFFRHHVAQVLMGSGNEANINHPVADFAQTAKAFFFQHLQQLGLHLHINVADFIKEDRSFVGNFQQSTLGGDGAGEGAFFVPEQFGFQKLAA